MNHFSTSLYLPAHVLTHVLTHALTHFSDRFATRPIGVPPSNPPSTLPPLPDYTPDGPEAPFRRSDINPTRCKKGPPVRLLKLANVPHSARAPIVPNQFSYIPAHTGTPSPPRVIAHSPYFASNFTPASGAGTTHRCARKLSRKRRTNGNTFASISPCP